MKLRALAIVAAAVAVLLLVAAGPGTRMGLWHFRTGLGLLRWAAWAGIAGVVAALIALGVTRPRGTGLWMLLIALVMSGTAVLLPWRMSQQARRVPPIHDITTDTQDPPEFVAVLAERAGTANPAAYGGDSVAVLQRQAYPDIGPLHLDSPPEVAFARALATANAMRWRIVAADTAAGRIEATATTTWFGFRDDVVIRIRPENGGSRVDVRSLSRVGRSDLGANAARVRAFLTRLASAGDIR
ncbi:MAG TPA: DUF1499 domain-containing protein [Gemmatimonadaceae bacterium]|nr:DUF1499 domain-containing protein [Gemmatimonadaceae bacterium]